MSTPAITFCEPPYVVTQRIAEFSNTVSSISYIVAGVLYSIYKIPSYKSIRKIMIAINMCIVGLGSMAFHASPSFETELSDETPMVSLMILILYDQLLEHPRVSQENTYRVVYSVTGVSGIFISYYVCTRQYALFLYTFSAIVAMNLLIYAHSCLYFPERRRKLLVGIPAFTASRIVWHIEQDLTESLYCYWLHACWHVLSAYCLYLFL